MSNNKHTKSTWDLTLIVGLVVGLSALTDTSSFMRFASSLELPIWAGIVFVLPVDFCGVEISHVGCAPVAHHMVGDLPCRPSCSSG